MSEEPGGDPRDLRRRFVSRNWIVIPHQDGVLHRCPCCHCLTLRGRGQYDICPVCFWEDDGQDDPHADEVWGGPNERLSLTEARENYRVFGAINRRVQQYVRPPTDDELPS